MEEEKKKKLNKILTKYDSITKEKEEEHRAILDFIQDFNSKRDNVIRPVLEKLVVYLEERGYTSEIEEISGSVVMEGRQQFFPEIALKVTPKGMKYEEDEKFPKITFSADLNYLRINVKGKMVDKFGHSSRIHESTYSIVKLTQDIIEDNVIEALQKALI